MPVYFADLNNDLILLFFHLLLDETKDFLAFSTTCRRIRTLSLHRSLWARAFDTHNLRAAFGHKSRFDAHILKEYVTRYLKTRKNLAHDIPQASSYELYRLETTPIQNPRSCFMHGRFTFYASGNGYSSASVEPISVGCYDMDDSLKSLWEKTGDWENWTRVIIRSCEITNRGERDDGGSHMTVLMQAVGKNLLNLRTFLIKNSGHSVELTETRSQHFEVPNQSTHAPFVHRGKWILRETPPPYLTNVDNLVSYLEVPVDSKLNASCCSFASQDHIIARLRDPLSHGTEFGTFGIPTDDPSRLGESMQNLYLPAQIHSLRDISRPPYDTQTFPSFIQTHSFLAIMTAGLGAESQSALVNIIAPDHIEALGIDYPWPFLGHPSQYRGWVFAFNFGFNARENGSASNKSQTPPLVLSKIQMRLDGGLEFGPVKEIVLPDDFFHTFKQPIYNSVFDEYFGRMYLLARSGLHVIDFA